MDGLEIRTTATIKLYQGEPEINLGGTSEPSFRAALETWLGLLWDRKLPGSKNLGPPGPLAIPPLALLARLTKTDGVWQIEFNEHGPKFLATTVPILACARVALSYLKGDLKPRQVFQ